MTRSTETILRTKYRMLSIKIQYETMIKADPDKKDSSNN